MDETIFMRGIYDYRACRVLVAVQLQDRGEHRAYYVSAYETIENVVITLFYEQGTDENYYDFFLMLHTRTSPGFPVFRPDRSRTLSRVSSAGRGPCSRTPSGIYGGGKEYVGRI